MRIIYFLTFITLTLTSCEVDKINSDDDLIESIINYDEKIVVLETELPIDSKVFIDEELPEEFIDRSLLANDLGFEIEMRNLDYKDLGLKKDNIYFDITGKKLEKSKKSKEDKKRENAKKEKCYYIQYPIKIKLPDDKIVEVSSKKEQSQILKEWYKKNPDVKVKSTYVYPISVKVFIDDKTMDEYEEYDLNSDDEFGELKERCKQSSD